MEGPYPNNISDHFVRGGQRLQAVKKALWDMGTWPVNICDTCGGRHINNRQRTEAAQSGRGERVRWEMGRGEGEE